MGDALISKRASVLFVAVAALGGVCRAQQFEVASIKPTPPVTTEIGCRSGRHIDPGRITIPCGTLAGLISWAYDLKGVPIEGGPGWVSAYETRYDLEAKAETSASVDQMRLMLRTLLADRFQLKMHREQPVRPVFALVVAKGGLKLHSVEPGTEIHGQIGFGMEGKTRVLTGAKAPVSELVAWMKSMVPERPIVDETGLTGAYDFKLRWLPEDDQPTVAFFSAIQDELGLKLEDRKAPVDVLVIDRAEKPLPNQ